MSPTSVEVLSILPHGILLSVLGNDYFISFNRLPWLKDAKLSDIMKVSMLGNRAISWSNLDIDLEIDSLKYPEKYPLLIKRNSDEIL